MTRTIVNQTSFTAGELSPRLLSRTDTREYANGLETATNCFSMTHGPIVRRNGSQYIATVKDSTKTTRLVKYQFSQDIAFILEFGDSYIRFYKDNGQVQSGGSPYEIVSPYAHTQVDDIEYKQIGSVMYITHPDVSPRQLIRTSDTDWTISEVDFYPPPTYESGYAPSTTITPAATTGVGINFTAGTGTFLEADIGRQIVNNSSGETGRASIISVTSSTVAVCDIVEDFTDTNAIASGDWMLDLTPIATIEMDSSQQGSIVNLRSEYTSGSYGGRVTITGVTNANPGVVTTSSSHGYVAGDKVLINDVVGMTQLNGNTYTVGAVTSTTFELKDDNNANVDTTSYTTYSSAGIARLDLSGNAIPCFRSDDVDRYILVNGGVMQILTVNSSTDVDAEIIKSLNETTKTSTWTLEQATWSATRGYPRAVGVFEQRLIFGGTATQPQNIWMSEVGIFDGFGTGPDNEDALDIELVSDEVNEINWISSSRDILVGTSGGEISINGSSETSITPSNVRQIPRTYHGSERQQVVNVKDEVLFVQGSSTKIRTLKYDFNLDGYTGESLNYLAEHMTEDGIKEIAYSQEPDTLLLAVLDTGDMLCGTYDRTKQVIAWSRWTTDGDYLSVQTITKGTEDQIWCIVQRKINGTNSKYIELFTRGNGTDDLHGFSDSYLTLSNNVAITGITQANPAVVTAASHGFSNGDTVIIKDLVDPAESDLTSTKTNMSSLNNCTFTVANKTTNTFELTGLDSSNYNAYGSSGNVWKKITAITGLTHLEAKSVQIKVDGASHPNKTVSSGAITLDNAAGEVVIGLAYTTTIKTLDTEYDIGLGSMQGQRSRWARPLLNVYKSARPIVNGEFIPSRSGSDAMGKKVPLYTGFLEYGSLKWSNTNAITITLNSPFPLQLSGITGTLDGGVK